MVLSSNIGARHTHSEWILTLDLVLLLIRIKKDPPYSCTMC